MGISTESGIIITYSIRWSLSEGTSLWNEFSDSGLLPDKVMVFSIVIFQQQSRSFLSTSHNSESPTPSDRGETAHKKYMF